MNTGDVLVACELQILRGIPISPDQLIQGWKAAIINNGPDFARRWKELDAPFTEDIKTLLNQRLYLAIKADERYNAKKWIDGGATITYGIQNLLNYKLLIAVNAGHLKTAKFLQTTLGGLIIWEP